MHCCRHLHCHYHHEHHQHCNNFALFLFLWRIVLKELVHCLRREERHPKPKSETEKRWGYFSSLLHSFTPLLRLWSSTNPYNITRNFITSLFMHCKLSCCDGKIPKEQKCLGDCKMTPFRDVFSKSYVQSILGPRWIATSHGPGQNFINRTLCILRG